MTSKLIVTSLAAAGFAVASGLAFAAGQYGPGASDTEIKIGNTNPYSGPASGYGVIGKSISAYFAMINDQAASTAARSISSAATTATARRRP